MIHEFHCSFILIHSRKPSQQLFPTSCSFVNCFICWNFFCISFSYPWTLLMKYFIFPIFPEKFYSMFWPILLYFFLFYFSTDNTPIQPSNYNQISFHHALLFLIVSTKLAQLALYLDCFWSHLFCLFWWWFLLFTWASCVLGIISLYRENGLPKFILNHYCVLKRLGKDLELEGNQPKDGPKIPSGFSYIEIVL